MANNVIFEGPTLTIHVANTVTFIDIKTDVYSAWKEWVQDADNAKWPQAISVVGGDPITDTLSLGSTFFLENGWRIKPWEGNYLLTVNGNLYTREAGENPIISVSGVATSLTRSNLIDLVTVDVGADANCLTKQDILDLEQKVDRNWVVDV